MCDIAIFGSLYNFYCTDRLVLSVTGTDRSAISVASATGRVPIKPTTLQQQQVRYYTPLRNEQPANGGSVVRVTLTRTLSHDGSCFHPSCLFFCLICLFPYFFFPPLLKFRSCYVTCFLFCFIILFHYFVSLFRIIEA